jgi:hypothetical protein
MQIELVKEAVEFFNIKRAWEALSDALGDSVSVFASFAWYETWWRHYSAGAVLNMFVMWDADRLVGIAPLMLRRATVHGLPATVVCFIENNLSLHNDFIVLPAVRELFLKEVLRYLFEHHAQWDAIVLNNLPPTSVNYVTLVKILDETGRKWRQNPTWFDSPYLIPSGTWAEYLANRTTRTRKSLRNIQNSMSKAGEVSVRNIRTWEEFLSVRNDIFTITRQSWAGKTGDTLASPANEAFLEDLARSAAAKGWLSVWALYLNGKMIAIEFHLRANGKEHAMRGHYLPEYADLSPGTFLEMQIIKSIFEDVDRLQKYDFGGSFENYKRKWTDDSISHRAVWVFGDRIYSRFIAFHETITVPLLRRFLPQKLWNNRVFRICGINPNRFDTSLSKQDII